jgi:hypothetical protein
MIAESVLRIQVQSLTVVAGMMRKTRNCCQEAVEEQDTSFSVVEMKVGSRATSTRRDQPVMQNANHTARLLSLSDLSKSRTLKKDQIGN